jgi:hypothetical protein
MADRLVVQLNGLTVVEHRGEPAREPGRIAIALTASEGQGADVAIKEIEILSLDDNRCR